MQRPVTLCLILAVNLIQGDKEDALSSITVAARPYCPEDSYIDYSLHCCVYIDRLQRRVPSFLPCPDDTVLQGRRCVGRIETDFELGCSMRQTLNRDGVCVESEVYSPPHVICPPGYKLRRSHRTRARVCQKRVYATPFLGVPLDGVADTYDRAIRCPDGFILRRQGPHADGTEEYAEPPESPEPPEYVFDEPPESADSFEFAESLEHAAEPNDHSKGHGKVSDRFVCVGEVVIPPEVKGSCITGYRWSPTLAACLMVTAVSPTKQCPEPDLRLGVQRGDWDTPTFVYDETLDLCVASWAKALYPRCPPGWALEGLFHPICYRKLFSPILLDCNHLEGSIFEWDERNKIGKCKLEYDTAHFAEGPSYLTQRERATSKMLLLDQTPWDVLEGVRNAEATIGIGPPAEREPPPLLPPPETVTEYALQVYADEEFGEADVAALVDSSLGTAFGTVSAFGMKSLDLLSSEEDETSSRLFVRSPDAPRPAVVARKPGSFQRIPAADGFSFSGRENHFKMTSSRARIF